MAATFGTGNQGPSLDQVMTVLLEQQAALKSISGMQAQFQIELKMQHKLLERRLGQMRQPAQQFGDNGAVPEVEEETIAEDGPSEANTDIITAPSTFKNFRATEADKQNNRKSARALRQEEMGRLPSRPSKKPGQFLIWLISHPLWDTGVGVLVFLNFVVLFVAGQWRAFNTYNALYGYSDDTGWDDVGDPVTDTVDITFTVIYFLEVLLQAIAFRGKILQRDIYHFLDATAVLVSVAQIAVLNSLFQLNQTQRAFFRLVKLFRMVRLLRALQVMHTYGMFSALHVLVRTISKSAGSLVWSSVVMGLIILGSALMVVQLTHWFILDDAHPFEHREWVYYNYGSMAKASYTMFECAFSGMWATHLSRPLIDHVSPWFRLFFVVYTVGVNFAVTRIIGALFLKQTLDVAAIDSEQKAAAKLKERSKVMDTLREIFKVGDVIGDGVLHKWEFEQMMENDKVLDMFEELEMEPPEVFMLYNILCEDDGVADQEEFLNGALKLKTQVRTVDVIQLLHEQMVVKRSIRTLEDGLHHLDKALHPNNPWKAKHVNVSHTIVPKSKSGLLVGSATPRDE